MHKSNYKIFNKIVFLIGFLYVLFCFNLLLNDRLHSLIQILRLIVFIYTLFYILNTSKSRKVIYIYIPLFLFYLTLGFLKGNWINFLILDILSFCLLLFVFFIERNNYDYVTSKIINLFSLLIILAFIIVSYYTITSGFQISQTTEERLGFSDLSFEGASKAIFYPIQICLLLLPFIKFVNKKRKFFIILASLFFLIINFLGLSRANILALIVSIILALYISYKNTIKIRFSKIIFSTLLISFLSIILLFQYKDIIDTSFMLLRNRLENIEDDDIRDIEAKTYFNSITSSEFIIGQGMGASNKVVFGRTYKRGIMMLHRGENNLILKGGVFLLILFYGVAFKSLLNLIRSKEVYSDSWASVIIIYLILERGHQQFSSPFMLLLFCLAISYGLAIPSRSKKRNFKTYEK
jgi:hypothetical protein